MTDVAQGSESGRMARWVRERAHAGRFVLHGVVWSMMWRLRLARQVSNVLCWLNVYHQYQAGICGWCGGRHGFARSAR